MATAVSESVTLGFGSATGQKYDLDNKTQSKYSFWWDHLTLLVTYCRCLFKRSVYFSTVILNNQDLPLGQKLRPVRRMRLSDVVRAMPGSKCIIYWLTHCNFNKLINRTQVALQPTFTFPNTLDVSSIFIKFISLDISYNLFLNEKTSILKFSGIKYLVAFGSKRNIWLRKLNKL